MTAKPRLQNTVLGKSVLKILRDDSLLIGFICSGGKKKTL